MRPVEKLVLISEETSSRTCDGKPPQSFFIKKPEQKGTSGHMHMHLHMQVKKIYKNISLFFLKKLLL